MADEAEVCGGRSPSTEKGRARSSGGVIEGRVIDDQLRPLADAKVSAQRVRGVGSQLEVWPIEAASSPRRGSSWGPTAVTNRLGIYRIEGLPPGPYYVSAIAPNPPQKRPGPGTRLSEAVGYGPTFYPGSTTVAYASSVRLRADDEMTGIDIRVEKRRLARLSGHVSGTRGRLDVEGASVRLAPSAMFGAGRLDAFTGHSALAADGAFSIEAVPPGDYVLIARSVSPLVLREVARTGSSEPLTRDPGAEFATLKVTVNGEDVTELELPLSAGGRIAGRITVDGRPYTPGRKYVAVVARPLDEDATIAGASEVGVTRDGTFEIRGVAGRFILRVGDIAPDMALARVELFGRDVADAGVIVSPRESVSDVTIMLTSSPTELTGRIAKPPADHSPAGPCTVLVFSDDANQWSLPSSRYVAVTSPQPGGVFSIVGLPPGNYLALAVRDADDLDAIDPEYLRRVARLGQKVRLREGETTAVALALH
ncbi:MAG: carboxypeptidase-like regulatory domain-containing protein [Vicinamibacteraceae bacterium]